MVLTFCMSALYAVDCQYTVKANKHFHIIALEKPTEMQRLCSGWAFILEQVRCHLRLVRIEYTRIHYPK